MILPSPAARASEARREAGGGKYSMEQGCRGFTLLEMSVVLVIIALIVGGILFGRDLIGGAAVRGQITQIGKFHTAVQVFQEKYGFLPGDIDAQTASAFGFTARGAYAGEGDGNGVIEGNYNNFSTGNAGYMESTGETGMFWVDLTTANGKNLNLIEGAFNTASATALPSVSPLTATSSPNLDAYFPKAKLGNGSYISVYSVNGINYFGLSGINLITAGWSFTPSWKLSVQQAYSIDQKMDDGLPESGNVTAQIVMGNTGGVGVIWVVDTNSGNPWATYTYGTAYTAATAGSSSTCTDNGNTGGAVQQYSVGQNSGVGNNCALSFRFQ